MNNDMGGLIPGIPVAVSLNTTFIIKEERRGKDRRGEERGLRKIFSWKYHYIGELEGNYLAERQKGDEIFHSRHTASQYRLEPFTLKYNLSQEISTCVNGMIVKKYCKIYMYR
jgi:hypothetical protein